VVSTQDFAHEVWQSLENIRERLAVLETEVRHTRRDLLRLEASLTAHIADHRRQDRSSSGKDDSSNGNGITIKISRTLLGLVGGLLAAALAVGKALGWW
jgi:hypothetical protein